MSSDHFRLNHTIGFVVLILTTKPKQIESQH